MAKKAPVIIGFDLGHGETAVSKTYARKTTPPAVLDLPGASGSGRQHVTAVNEHAEHGVLVGEAAVDMPGGKLYLGFKSRALDQPGVRRPMELFASKVRDDLVAAGKIGEPAQEVRWVFGAPSGWSSTLRENYAKLLRASGFTHVEVVPESRAAMLYARDAGETGVRLDAGQIAGRVLIVDLGSSTTDFTIVEGRRDRPTDLGTELGASLIDRTICERVLAEHEKREELDDAIHRDRNLRLKLELACRKAKEAFFRLDPKLAAAPGASVFHTVRVDTADGRILVNIELTQSDIESILDTPLPKLGGRTWREAYREDLAEIAAVMETAPDAVLLTGGASRMHFVLDIAREQFGAGKVMLGTEPESAIARGLALAGRINLDAAGFLQDIAALVDGNQIEKLVTERLPKFANRLGKAAADGITSRHIIPAFRDWRQGRIETLNQVAEQIAKKVEKELKDPENTVVASAFADWFNDLRPDLEELTRPICTRWHIPATAMRLPEIDISSHDWEIHRPDTAVATDLLENLAHVINGVIAGVVSATLLGAGVAIIASTGPFAVVVVAVGVWVALAHGTDKAKEKAKDYNIPLWIRQLRSDRGLVAKLEANATAQEKELAKELASQFLKDGGQGMAAEISKSIATQFAKLADDAKLLVS